MAEPAVPRVVLFVMDAGPLLTLAAADALDYLKLPNVPVYVPDAVFYEATVKFGALGAEDILAWAQANRDVLHIVPTAVFANVQIAQDQARPGERVRVKGLGELAALEVARESLPAHGSGERAVLVLEDVGALRAARLPPYDDQVLPITTRDFLSLLEQEGRINSADSVYLRAEDAGRYAARIEAAHALEGPALDAVRRALALQPTRSPRL